MADENEDQNDNVNQDVEQNEQITTGDKQWDSIIDKAAGLATGEQDANKTSTGKTTDDKTTQQQVVKKPGEQQQSTDTTQRRPGASDDQGNQQVRSAARKFGDLFQSDQSGNIYDSRGTLIAKQGAQRAIFHRLYPTIEAQARELAAHRQTIENYTQANELAKRENISLDEYGAALQMFASYKKDPLKTVQTLLTLMEQSGRDISSIRQGQGVGVADIRSAVQEIVQEAIKPFSFLTEQQRQSQEQQALHDEVITEYQSFIEEYPDARTHEETIANVMRDKQVNHREAYFAVRAFAAENGLDWKQPLAPQLMARDRKPSGEGNNRRPLPNMNGRNRVEQAHVPDGARDQHNASDSWDTIARKSIKDVLGIDV